MTPATNAFPIEASTKIQTIIVPTFGGIRASRVPPAAIQPMLSDVSYLYFLSSGNAILANTAEVAILEPHAAPNMPAAPTVTIKSPPPHPPPPPTGATDRS